ncbi:FliH/SctL family protein [Thermoproteota archaeon]
MHNIQPALEETTLPIKSGKSVIHYKHIIKQDHVIPGKKRVIHKIKNIEDYELERTSEPALGTPGSYAASAQTNAQASAEAGKDTSAGAGTASTAAGTSPGLHTTPSASPSYSITEEDKEQYLNKLTKKSRANLDKELEDYRSKAYSSIEKEKQETIEHAHQQGLEQGKKEGLEIYNKKVEEFLTTLSSAVNEKNKILHDSKKEVLDLAIIIAKQLIKEQVSLKPEIINKIVEEAIKKITDKDKVIIRVNSADLQTVQKYRIKILEIMSDIRHLEVHEDPFVDQGGCVIETKLGFIDSKVSTKLSGIQTALETAYEEELEEEADTKTQSPKHPSKQAKPKKESEEKEMEEDLLSSEEDDDEEYENEELDDELEEEPEFEEEDDDDDDDDDEDEEEDEDEEDEEDDDLAGWDFEDEDEEEEE